MKVVLDSNVLVSAFATRGLCAELFQMVIEEHELILCPPILDEVKRILIEKIKVPSSKVDLVISFLSEFQIHTHRQPIKLAALNDRADEFILSFFVGSDVDCFVTGDKDVLSLKKVEGVNIMSPREFWQKNHEKIT